MTRSASPWPTAPTRSQAIQDEREPTHCKAEADQGCYTPDGLERTIGCTGAIYAMQAQIGLPP